jgi:hypothetical protein
LDYFHGDGWAETKARRARNSDDLKPLPCPPNYSTIYRLSDNQIKLRSKLQRQKAPTANSNDERAEQQAFVTKNFP